MATAPRVPGYMYWVGWGVPGVVGRGVGREGGREGYTGTQPSTLPGPIFSTFPEISPTYGQMKAISVYL